MGSTSAATQSTQTYTDTDYYYGFGFDLYDGHGTHTAGSAAGATLNSPARALTCGTNQTLGCIGRCLSEALAIFLLAYNYTTWDTLCPQFNCDTVGDPCLGDNVNSTLTEGGGVAQGAKISVFDASVHGRHVLASLALNGLWESTNGTGSFLHSNSWGIKNDCNIDSLAVAYDEYIYEVRREALVWRLRHCRLPLEAGG